jgi:hypothetical protein
MLNKSRLGLILNNQTRFLGFKKRNENEDFKRF